MYTFPSSEIGHSGHPREYAHLFYDFLIDCKPFNWWAISILFCPSLGLGLSAAGQDAMPLTWLKLLFGVPCQFFFYGSITATCGNLPNYCVSAAWILFCEEWKLLAERPKSTTSLWLFCNNLWPFRLILQFCSLLLYVQHVLHALHVLHVLHARTHACMHVCMYVGMYVCMYVLIVGMYACMYVCMYWL